MAEELASISPSVLKWARTSLGLSLNDVAIEMGKNEEVIASWEDGGSAPTYAQLEKLAYTVFKRPLAMFFLAEPPSEPPMRAEFRTYLATSSKKLERDTVFAIREAKARQIYLDEFASDSVDREALSIVTEAMQAQGSLVSYASEFRRRLGVSEAAISNTSKAEDALSIWRNAVEALGVFVFKRAFKQEDLSGFCVADATYPLVYINNKNSFTRQSFTIFHETAHLSLGISGVCAVEEDYIDALPAQDRRVELRCDAFAAEVLVPSPTFKRLAGNESDEAKMRALARQFRVSPAVIARKYFDARMIGRDQYTELMRSYFSDNWRQNERDGDSEAGGNYYNTQLQYLSRRYVSEAYRKFTEGKISAPTFADYLGVKVSSLKTLESKILSRG